MNNILCGVEGCGGNYYARGFCHKHYYSWYWRNRLKSRGGSLSRKCEIEGCGKPHYARGMCNSHYTLNVRGGYIRRKCEVEGCDHRVNKPNVMCAAHVYRTMKGLPMFGKLMNGKRGDQNPNWNGGTSQYKNHYTLKINRLKRIKMVGGKCEKCGSSGRLLVNVLDKNDTTYPVNKLMMLCTRCHGIMRSDKGISKYKKLYGMRMVDIMRRLNISHGVLIRLHNDGVLKWKVDLLKSINEVEELIDKNKSTEKIGGL